MAITTPPAGKFDSSSSGQDYSFALTSLTFLFFIWGFITCLNDILIPHLKNVFDLSYTQAALIQFCFFSAYFIVSLPAGLLVRRVGYQRGMVIGLLIAASGCVLFYPAAATQTYALFLTALFVLASGITILQVAANPYVTALGPAATASSRLTMTQAFNSLGTTVAPLFDSLVIIGGVTAAAGTPEYKVEEAAAVQLPYLGLAGALIVLAVVFAFLKLPLIAEHQQEDKVNADPGSAWRFSHLWLGALGIFVYVGAEVSIGSFLVNFMGEPHIAGLVEKDAAQYLTYYWGGAMVGRFIGAVVMQKIAAGKVLAFNSIASVLLIGVAIHSSGPLAMWALLAVGLFNSVMFPTIFSLAVTGLGRFTSNGSGVLCAAIVGGAIIPVLQGVLADHIGLQLSFFVPLLCYLYICYYGLVGSRIKQPQVNQ
jgi:FHS family L-fucose permease-like MFS transporter